MKIEVNLSKRIKMDTIRISKVTEKNVLKCVPKNVFLDLFSGHIYGQNQSSYKLSKYFFQTCCREFNRFCDITEITKYVHILEIFLHNYHTI